jgi:hypothetical protein
MTPVFVERVPRVDRSGDGAGDENQGKNPCSRRGHVQFKNMRARGLFHELIPLDNRWLAHWFSHDCYKIWEIVHTKLI